MSDIGEYAGMYLIGRILIALVVIAALAFALGWWVS